MGKMLNFTILLWPEGIRCGHSFGPWKRNYPAPDLNRCGPPGQVAYFTADNPSLISISVPKGS